jgi:hypothetical protein
MRPGDDPTRDHLITAILHAFPDFEDVAVADHSSFPSPGPIGRHAPDYQGRSYDRLVIALAKKGEELADAKTSEQIEDIARHADRDGYPPTFWLFVTGGWRQQAEATIRRAAAEAWHDRMGVKTVGIPGVPGPPGA